jgi:uroporphyrin-III C-methyltransferase
MGLMKSEYIQSQLVEHGRNPDTPIAIIERGTQSTQRIFKGQLAQLAELAKDAQSPSLIVIGEVVSLSDKLAWFNPQPQTQQRQFA